MERKREDREARPTIWPLGLVVFLAFLLLLIVYPLSMGPMLWICSDESNALMGFKGQSFLFFYGPALMLQDAPEPIGEMVRQWRCIWEK
jgi:hypothetical protein